jgi:hypothetical protein
VVGVATQFNDVVHVVSAEVDCPTLSAEGESEGAGLEQLTSTPQNSATPSA